MTLDWTQLNANHLGRSQGLVGEGSTSVLLASNSLRMIQRDMV